MYISTIHELSLTSSYGIDYNTSKMLHYSASILSPCLAQLFNASIIAGVFPDTWKMAVVVPVEKKGNIFDISNYRSISLLSLISKVVEKLICLQVT